MTSSVAVPNQDNVGRGIALALVAMFIFSTQDATSKFLVESISPFQMTMMRFWAFGAMSLVIAWRQGPITQALRTSHPWLQIARGILLIVDIWLFVLALRTVQLPELQAITLVYPLLVTLFAIPLLGESVGIFRISAVAVGFLGALVIVRPGGVPFDSGVFYAVASGIAYALYLVLTRKVSATDSASTSIIYVGVVGLVVSGAVGIFFWQPLDFHTTLLVLYIMLTGCAGHGLMILALSSAPASVLQPFNYSSLPWSILWSWLLFQHLIDPISLVGAAVIVAAGLVVMVRERIRKIPASAAAAPPGKE